jgi:hypothetical protein
MSPPVERWTTVVLRIWAESTSPDGFRARLIIDRGETGVTESYVVDTVESLVERLLGSLQEYLPN